MVSWAFLGRLAEPGRFWLSPSLADGGAGCSSWLGLNLRTRLLPLQNGNLVAQLLDKIPLLLDHVQQRQHQRCAFFNRYFGKSLSHNKMLGKGLAISCAKSMGY